MAFTYILGRQKIPLAFLFGLLCPVFSHAQLVFATMVDPRPSSITAQRILVQAYRQLGITLKFEALPNYRVARRIDEGSIDGVDFRIADTKVGDMQKIAVPIAYEELVVFSVNPRFKVDGYGSLQPYSIGYLSGAKIFEDKLKGMRIDTAPSLESLFNKLEAGRTDIAVDSRASYCRTKKFGPAKIVMLEPSLEKILAYHWLSKRHESLMPRLEAVLKKMQRDDTIRKIQEEAWKDYNAQCGLDTPNFD